QRAADIRAKLAPRCGTPTNWTPAQKRAVADVIEKNATEPGMVLLATEWRRETRATRTCRGEGM
ncbi:MAG: hypothetical protein QM651_18510, partial [Rhodoblastus sp.]